MDLDVKHLGIILDNKLTWSRRLKTIRKNLNSRLHLLRPILKSKLICHDLTKNIVYKALPRPVWVYAIQIRRCAKPSQICSIQAFPTIALYIYLLC